MRLLGIPVHDDDLRGIVPTLLHGDETSRTLAGRIASGLDRRVALLAHALAVRRGLQQVGAWTRLSSSHVTAADAKRDDLL